MGKYIALNIKCPECKHSLMDPYHTINDLPSVKLTLHAHGEKGGINICSYYGCTDHVTDIEVNDGEVTRFTCPHCETELSSGHLCRECNSPMIPFDMERGGRLYMCSRKGCNMHFLNFHNVSDALRRMYNEYGYF